MLGGQLLALKLNVGFSCAGVFNTLSIADATLCYGTRPIPADCAGPFAGLTVNQFLTLADLAVAGDLNVLNPYGAILADLNIAASCMNELFDGCDPIAPAVGFKELAEAGCDLGDINRDARVSSSDLVLMINYIFKGGAAPKPYREVADFNYDYNINSSDIIELVAFIFRGGRPTG